MIKLNTFYLFINFNVFLAIFSISMYIQTGKIHGQLKQPAPSPDEGPLAVSQMTPE